MSALVELLDPYANRWLTLAVAVVWQSTLLALIVAAITLLLRRASPSVRYWLWQICAIKLLVMPVLFWASWTWTLPIGSPALPPADGSQPVAHAGQPTVHAQSASTPTPGAKADTGLDLVDLNSHEAAETVEGVETVDAIAQPAAVPVAAQDDDESVDPPTSRLASSPPPVISMPAASSPAPEPAAKPVWYAWLVEFNWQGVLVACFVIYLLILALLALQLLVQRSRLKRLLHSAEPADAVLAGRVAAAARTLGLFPPPETLVTAADYSPFVCGLRRAKLVISRRVLDELTADELQPVLLHELAHLVRRDLLWGWLPEIAWRVWFFHPVAHWVANRARLERELACDHLAMAHASRTPAEYADLLVRAVATANH